MYGGLGEDTKQERAWVGGAVIRDTSISHGTIQLRLIPAPYSGSPFPMSLNNFFIRSCLFLSRIVSLQVYFVTASRLPNVAFQNHFFFHPSLPANNIFSI